MQFERILHFINANLSEWSNGKYDDRVGILFVFTFSDTVEDLFNIGDSIEEIELKEPEWI